MSTTFLLTLHISGFLIASAVGEDVQNPAVNALIQISCDAVRAAVHERADELDDPHKRLLNQLLELLVEHGDEAVARELAESAGLGAAPTCIERALIRRAAAIGDWQEIAQRISALEEPIERAYGLGDATSILCEAGHIDECRRLLKSAESHLAEYKTTPDHSEWEVFLPFLHSWVAIGDHKRALAVVQLATKVPDRSLLYYEVARKLTISQREATLACIDTAKNDLRTIPPSTERDDFAITVAHIIGRMGEPDRMIAFLNENGGSSKSSYLLRQLAVEHAERHNYDAMQRFLSMLTVGERADILPLCARRVASQGKLNLARELLTAAEELVSQLPQPAKDRVSSDIANVYGHWKEFPAAWMWVRESGEYELATRNSVIIDAFVSDNLTEVRTGMAMLPRTKNPMCWYGFIRLLVLHNSLDEAIAELASFKVDGSENPRDDGLRGMFSALAESTRFGVADDMFERYEKGTSIRQRDEWLQILACSALGAGNVPLALKYLNAIQVGEIRRATLRMAGQRILDDSEFNPDLAVAFVHGLSSPWEQLEFVVACRLLVSTT